MRTWTALVDSYQRVGEHAASIFRLGEDNRFLGNVGYHLRDYRSYNADDSNKLLALFNDTENNVKKKHGHYEPSKIYMGRSRSWSTLKCYPVIREQITGRNKDELKTVKFIPDQQILNHCIRNILKHLRVVTTHYVKNKHGVKTCCLEQPSKAQMKTMK